MVQPCTRAHTGGRLPPATQMMVEEWVVPTWWKVDSWYTYWEVTDGTHLLVDEQVLHTCWYVTGGTHLLVVEHMVHTCWEVNNWFTLTGKLTGEEAGAQMVHFKCVSIGGLYT